MGHWTDTDRSNLVLLLIMSHPGRAILPVVLSESSELETRLRVFCLKIVFEVVFIEVTSKKAVSRGKVPVTICSRNKFQLFGPPITSYPFRRLLSVCWLRQSCLRDRTSAAPETQEQGLGLCTTFGVSKFPPFSFFSHSAQKPSSWAFD